MTAYIDLRSDTVTQPTPAMREAMARAEVGDDVYGEDPTVRTLEERVAHLLGKEAAIFVPSGTMGNQLAIMTSTRPGDEVVCGDGAHSAWFESGAGAALSGVQFTFAGTSGLFTVDDLEGAIKPPGHSLPRTSLVILENTHSRAGGRIFPQTDVQQIAERAHLGGLRVHLDGARLWNVSARVGLSPAELAAPCDTLSVCFSKGLGAPVGSALAGPADQIREARRLRKMLGAGMRQAGILAAGAHYALDHHLAWLARDHAHARLFAERLGALTRRTVATVIVPETNIVNIELACIDGGRVTALARERGVLVGTAAARLLRAVFHLDIDASAAEAAATRLAEAIGVAARN